MQPLKIEAGKSRQRIRSRLPARGLGSKPGPQRDWTRRPWPNGKRRPSMPPPPYRTIRQPRPNSSAFRQPRSTQTCALPVAEKAHPRASRPQLPENFRNVREGSEPEGELVRETKRGRRLFACRGRGLRRCRNRRRRDGRFRRQARNGRSCQVDRSSGSIDSCRRSRIRSRRRQRSRCRSGRRGRMRRRGGGLGLRRSGRSSRCGRSRRRRRFG